MTTEDTVYDRIALLAPQRLDDDHLESLLTSTWDRVGATAPQERTPWSQRLRPVAVGAATLVLAGVGSGAALAVTGHDQITTYLAHLFDPGDPDGAETSAPETATMVLSTPAPGGLELQGWTVAGTEGGLCTAVFLVAPGDPDPSTTDVDALRDRGASCSIGHTSRGLFENLSASFDTPGPVALTVVAQAGPQTARVVLQVSNGTTYAVALDDGWLGGAFTPAQVPRSAHATLVAYDAAGTVEATYPLT